MFFHAFFTNFCEYTHSFTHSFRSEAKKLLTVLKSLINKVDYENKELC